jgi:hypothetical protein
VLLLGTHDFIKYTLRRGLADILVGISARAGGGGDRGLPEPLAVPEWITSDCAEAIWIRHNRSGYRLRPGRNVDALVTFGGCGGIVLCARARNATDKSPIAAVGADIGSEMSARLGISASPLPRDSVLRSPKRANRFIFHDSLAFHVSHLANLIISRGR